MAEFMLSISNEPLMLSVLLCVLLSVFVMIVVVPFNVEIFIGYRIYELYWLRYSDKVADVPLLQASLKMVMKSTTGDSHNLRLYNY